MDKTETPTYRLTSFLTRVRGSERVGCRASSHADHTTATKLELRYHETADGPEHMLGLRAELRDGVPVIVLYEQSELAQPAPAAAL